jgi:hypothetical protein
MISGPYRILQFCVRRPGQHPASPVRASSSEDRLIKVKDADLPVMTMVKISSSTITMSTPRCNSITNVVIPGTAAYSAREDE